MTIVYFYQYFGTTKGSWSTRVYDFAQCWVGKGHRVTVVTTVYDKSDITAARFIDRQQIDGIDVIVINVRLSNKHSFYYRLYTFGAYLLMASYYALTLKYDIAIASSGPITVGIPGLIASWFRRKPLIFEVRDLWPDGAIEVGSLKSAFMKKIAYWVEHQCYRSATRVIALSDGIRKSITDRFGFDHVQVIENASDNDLFGDFRGNFELPPWAVDKKIFLFTGTFGEKDDVRQIVESAKIIQERNETNIIFVLIGDGKHRKGMEVFAKKGKLSNIFFVDLIPKEQVASWLHHAVASFLIIRNLPALSSGSPNKMFDAFAAGVPVIQNTTGWIKDLFDHENCGISVAPNEPLQIADAIEILAKNPEIRAEKATNAKRLAIERFDRNRLAGEMLSILTAVS